MRSYRLSMLNYALAVALASGCSISAPDSDPDGRDSADVMASESEDLDLAGTSSALYIMEDRIGPNHVLAMRRDRKTGKLGNVQRYATGGDAFRDLAGLQQHAVVTNQRSLYAVNPGSNTISAFEVKADGALRLINTAPSGGEHPGSLAIHPAGFLYVANQGAIPFAGDPTPGSYAVLRIRHDGGLQEVPGGVVALPDNSHPADILVSPDGQHVVAMRLEGDVIDSFRVAADGRLVSPTLIADQPAPFGGVFLPNRPSELVVMLSAANAAGDLGPGVASYAIPQLGAPVRVSVANDPASIDPCWAVVSPDGQRLWTSAFLSRTTTEFSVDRRGRLTRVSALVPPATDGQGATDIAMDQRGKFLYELRAFDVATDGGNRTVPRVQVFAVEDSSHNAGLRLVQDMLLPTDLDDAGVEGMAIVE